MVMAALGIITDRNSTDYWYQSKALPAQTVCHLEPPSIPLMFYVVPPELLGFIPGFVVTGVCTNLDFHCFLTSESDVKGILSTFRETIFQEEVLIIILPRAGRIGVHF